MTSAVPRSARLGVVDLVAVEEHHDVGVLLEGARLTEVGEHRALVGAHLEAAGELRRAPPPGTSSSRARILRPRLISDTSTWRFSALARPVMSWR